MFSFFSAELLLSRGGYFGQEAHSDLCAAKNRPRRGADVRLQISLRGHQNSVHLRLSQV